MVRMIRYGAAFALVGFLSAACASTGPGGPSRDPDRIAEEEIRDVSAGNVYELIERLRPRWLRVPFDRSTRLATRALVYLDGALLGEVELARGIPVAGVVSMRYLDSAEAGKLPGAGSEHVAGAILISTGRSGS